MWKKVYAIYFLVCPNNTMQEATIKELLHDSLKEVKLGEITGENRRTTCDKK